MARLGTHQAPATYAREQAPARCCARCKTPYGCGNAACRCHDQEADDA